MEGNDECKNIIKIMIMCIILTRIMCENTFTMMKMNVSMTIYQIAQRRRAEREKGAAEEIFSLRTFSLHEGERQEMEAEGARWMKKSKA